MQYTSDSGWRHIGHALPLRMHLWAALCFLALVGLGQPLEVCTGWVAVPPTVYGVPSRRADRQGVVSRGGVCWSAGWRYLRCTWHVPVIHSALLVGLWGAAGRPGAGWLVLLPWLMWIGQGGILLWPGLAHQPAWRIGEQVARWALAGALWVYAGLALGQGISKLAQAGEVAGGWQGYGLGSSVCCAGFAVVVTHEAQEGSYRVDLQGRFTLRVGADDPFRVRLLVLFLRLLEDPAEQRGSRRTRDGRTPLVRQEYLAGVLGIPQPVLSRWEGYWQKADWRRLLSQKSPEVLTLELQEQIIRTWAHWPSWGVEQIHALLGAQGIAVSESQVRQAAQESGWEIVRQVVGGLCVQQGKALRLREGWLLGDLLGQIERLLGKVEAGEGLTPEEHLDLAAWQQVSQAVGAGARPVPGAQPWLQRLEQVLFAPWTEVAAEGVRCPHCGSGHVGRKGLKPRHKRFVDEHGEVQTVEVYRYRCHNRDCRRESFTVLPEGLAPYSRQRREVHVLALQMYAWGYSTYRRTGQALGVAGMTAYRWVSAFGDQLLPIAALLGVVQSSGVVGVDEKWVQVPKNDKPDSPRRKWMYVYLAVDVHTYDLLHIALYPCNTSASAQAFLFALRAKGYHPRVVVTDLRQDYGPALARVFPDAQHHECLFHAMQALHTQLADIYGWDALHHDPQVITLRQALDAPLSASTPASAQQRYDELLAQRATWTQAKPELGALFDSLAAHWPKLLNGIQSDLIPRTNNTVELVIRRFDQHYQNFCGFDSLQTAQTFLGVFEKVYRFTPFSADAQPRLRGKSPLQLAGYDVSQWPMAAICSGWAFPGSTRTPSGGVPNP
jgi:transposase-like protein